MKRFFLAIGLTFLTVGAVAWHFQASSLYINGNLASSAIIERNGVSYVPIKDIAAALKLNLQKTPRGIELIAAGGANQAEGVAGKVGDLLWNGFVRFQVLKVIRGKEYTHQFSGDNEKETADPGKDIVVLVCRIKNGIKQDITVGMPAGDETGLTDTEGHSYAPLTGIGIDVANRAQDLLQGASVDFGLRFQIPEQATLQDLVYATDVVGMPDVNKKKFRVSLKQ